MVFYLSRKTPRTRTSSGSSLIQFTIKTNTRNLFSTPFVQIQGDTTLKQHKKKTSASLFCPLSHVQYFPDEKYQVINLSKACQNKYLNLQQI